MIVTIEPKQTKPEYPYLAIHRDDLHREDPLIVMFYEHNNGNVLSKNKIHPISYFNAHFWLEREYEPFQGQLTLSN